MDRFLRITTLLLVAASVSLAAFALETVDAPDSAVNPQSAGIETADPILSGSNQDLRYVIDGEAGEPPTIETITDHSLSDRDPQLVISSGGDVWVAWWRDDSTDLVLVRKRSYTSGTWGTEQTLSDTAESSRNPAIVHDGTEAWVGFEFDDGTDTGIAVRSIIDEPDPVGSIAIASTPYTGQVKVRIHAESGALWVTWIDSSTDVGWAEYDSTTETWSTESFESYATDTPAAARSRVRETVLGL